MNVFSLGKHLKPAVKLYWWRLNEGRPGEPGNFGDEISKLIIETIFHRRVEWVEVERCEIIGAGSLIEEVTGNKGKNRPYLWGSGFIQAGDLTISSLDYEIKGVRGKESLKRITGEVPPDISLGDPGLLASYLIKPPRKHYKLGILPHYVDTKDPFVTKHAGNPDVIIIDPLQSCVKVIEQVAECDAVISSSLHGLIVSDSLDVPNLHLKLGDGLKGGLYKFNDYYSIYSESRYHQVTPEGLKHLDAHAIADLVHSTHKPVQADEMKAIKQGLIDSFPLR